MRDYVGTFWRPRFGSLDGEFLVVAVGERRGTYALLEVETGTFHPATIVGWDDVLQVRRFYRGSYFDNHTLVPVAASERSGITSL